MCYHWGCGCVIIGGVDELSLGVWMCYHWGCGIIGSARIIGAVCNIGGDV